MTGDDCRRYRAHRGVGGLEEAGSGREHQVTRRLRKSRSPHVPESDTLGELGSPEFFQKSPKRCPKGAPEPRFGPDSAKIGRHRANLGRFRSIFARSWPASAKLYLNSARVGRNLSGVGYQLAELGQHCSNLADTWSKLAELSQCLAKFSVSLSPEVGPNLGFRATLGRLFGNLFDNLAAVEVAGGIAFRDMWRSTFP